MDSAVRVTPGVAAAAVRGLPLGIAVLCRACGDAVPLVLFVAGPTVRRQVRCPGCAGDVVLHDAW